MATRSMPMPSWAPVSMASLSLVPTPSVAATSSGSLKPHGLRSNRPPNPPMPPNRPVRCGLGGEWADGLDQRIARIDIDAGVAIGERGLVLGFRGHALPLGSRMRGSSASAYQAADACPSRPVARPGSGPGAVTFARCIGIWSRWRRENDSWDKVRNGLRRCKGIDRSASALRLALMAAPAQAAEDTPYTVSKIAVDVTAKNAVAAKAKAMAEAAEARPRYRAAAGGALQLLWQAPRPPAATGRGPGQRHLHPQGAIFHHPLHRDARCHLQRAGR